MENEIMNNVEEIVEMEELVEVKPNEGNGIVKPALITIVVAGAAFACYKLGKIAKKAWDDHKAKKEAENQGAVIEVSLND